MNEQTTIDDPRLTALIAAEDYYDQHRTALVKAFFAQGRAVDALTAARATMRQAEAQLAVAQREAADCDDPRTSHIVRAVRNGKIPSRNDVRDAQAALIPTLDTEDTDE